jgi:predicted PurR-regulated permease PerM
MSESVVVRVAEPDIDANGSPASDHSPQSGAAHVNPAKNHKVNHRGDLRTIKRIFIGILVLLILVVCYVAQEVLIPLTLALLLSLLLSPVVTFLQRFLKLPRLLGSIFVLMGVVVAMGGGITLLAQPARDWVANMPATIQSIQQRFRSFREPLQRAEEATKKLESLTQSGEKTTVVSAQPSLLTSMATGTPRVLSGVAAVLLLVYFFLSSGDSFLRRMVEIAPGLSEKKTVVSIARDVQDEMSRYLLMVSVINLVLGIITAAIMALLGVPNPLLWGAVAGVLNFAPYIGPTMTGIVLLIVGFTTFDTLAAALAVPGCFLALAFVEGQLVTPTIIGRRLALDPTVVFVWLLLWGWLWGIVGVLLAGPLIACFRIVCQHVDSLNSVCVLISDGSAPEHGARK